MGLQLYSLAIIARPAEQTLFSLQGESQDGVTSSVLKKKSKDTKLLLPKEKKYNRNIGGKFHSQVPTPHRACFSRKKVMKHRQERRKTCSSHSEFSPGYRFLAIREPAPFIPEPR